MNHDSTTFFRFQLRCEHDYRLDDHICMIMLSTHFLSGGLLEIPPSQQDERFHLHDHTFRVSFKSFGRATPC